MYICLFTWKFGFFSFFINVLYKHKRLLLYIYRRNYVRHVWTSTYIHTCVCGTIEYIYSACLCLGPFFISLALFPIAICIFLEHSFTLIPRSPVMFSNLNRFPLLSLGRWGMESFSSYVLPYLCILSCMPLSMYSHMYYPVFWYLIPCFANRHKTCACRSCLAPSLFLRSKSLFWENSAQGCLGYRSRIGQWAIWDIMHAVHMRKRRKMKEYR